MSSLTTDRFLTVQDMQELIVEAYQKNPKQNIGFIGEPGMGKTEGIVQAAKTLGIDIVVMILSDKDSIDFHMPIIDKDGSYRLETIENMKFAKDAKLILFWDEAANCSHDVMKVVQQVLSARKLGDTEIPDGVMIVIASNNKSDRAGANTFLSAFANRIEWHKMGVDSDQWLKNFAVPVGLDTSICSYIKKFPNTLQEFKADRMVNPTCRTWFKVNDVLGSKFEFDRVAGLIGDEHATQFIAWRKLREQFPEREDIEQVPEKAKLPHTANAQFALVCAMTIWANKKNWSAFYVYVCRLNKEYQTLYFKETTRLHPTEGFKNTKEYVEWAVDNQGTLI
jgi:hypothetical protein